jgi:hypothetical protein
MILNLAEALDVPLRERNALLAAAGFAPVYTQADLGTQELAQVRRAIDAILRQQEPHPAVVMDRHWNIVASNEGARRLFGRLVDLSTVPQPPNVLRLMFDPHGVRPFVMNWEQVARGLLVRVGREAVCGAPDPGLRALVDEITAYQNGDQDT